MRRKPAIETDVLTCAALVPLDAPLQRPCKRKPMVYRNDKYWCNQHAPWNEGRLQTHSAGCWHWHHACAVARVEELRMTVSLLRSMVLSGESMTSQAAEQVNEALARTAPQEEQP